MGGKWGNFWGKGECEFLGRRFVFHGLVAFSQHLGFRSKA